MCCNHIIVNINRNHYNSNLMNEIQCQSGKGSQSLIPELIYMIVVKTYLLYGITRSEQ